MGLCPLHEDDQQGFLVDANKDLFNCYGRSRRGGRDTLIRDQA
jgi:DNA primase